MLDKNVPREAREALKGHFFVEGIQVGPDLCKVCGVIADTVVKGSAGPIPLCRKHETTR